MVRCPEAYVRQQYNRETGSLIIIALALISPDSEQCGEDWHRLSSMLYKYTKTLWLTLSQYTRTLWLTLSLLGS